MGPPLPRAPFPTTACGSNSTLTTQHDDGGSLRTGSHVAPLPLLTPHALHNNPHLSLSVHAPAQTPTTNLTIGLTYSFCIWARLGSGSPASASAVIAMVNSRNYATTGATVTITPTWQRLCRASIQVADTTGVYFTLALAATAAAYQLDDAVLESASSSCVPSSSSPSPSPSPKPSPSPLTSPSPKPSPSPWTSPSPKPSPSPLTSPSPKPSPSPSATPSTSNTSPSPSPSAGTLYASSFESAPQNGAVDGFFIWPVPPGQVVVTLNSAAASRTGAFGVRVVNYVAYPGSVASYVQFRVSGVAVVVGACG